MNKVTLIFALCFFTFISPFSFAGEPDKKLETKCLRPAVQVFDNSARGSGVIVRSEKNSEGQFVNIVLTCKHVIEGMDDLYVALNSHEDWSKIDLRKSETYEARVLGKYAFNDIAIVYFVSKKELPYADIGFDEKLYLGNDVVSVGFAIENWPRLDFGKITMITNTLLGANLFTASGDSGGPVYHNYKLMGLKKAYLMGYSGEEKLHFSHVSLHVPVTTSLKEWRLIDNTAAVAYDPDTAVPLLPALILGAKEFKSYSSVFWRPSKFQVR